MGNLKLGYLLLFLVFVFVNLGICSSIIEFANEDKCAKSE